MKVTADESKNILAHDLAKFEDRVERAMPGVPRDVFDGAVSFDFNTGAIHRASWVSKFKDGRFREAEASLKLWCKAGGRIVKGLVRRRADEADLIFRGKYGANNP
jgi:lysozyme